MEMPNPQVARASKGLFGSTFYTLRYRDFRLFWISLTISLLGVSFQTVAQGWLVYRLTDSEFMLGLTGFVPAVLSAPAALIGGMIADRVSRRNLVIVTQSLMVLPPALVSYLVWTSRIEPWHVIAATAALGMIAAVDLPSRTAMVPHLVPADDLLNAQGLASAVGQVARIVGPALAGVIIARWGEAIPYLINSVTYIAMVVALLMMRPQPAPARDPDRERRGWIFDGMRYVFKTPLVFGLFAIAACQGLFLSSYTTLLPVFAKDILQAGPEGLGWLSAAAGLGALIGALGVANLRTGMRGKLLYVGGLLMPFLLAAFGWSAKMLYSLPLLLMLGFGTVFIRTITATFVLMLIPDNLRGRVMSLATLVYYGAPYAGGLPIGFLAEHFGAPLVLNLAGVLFLLAMISINRLVPAIRKQE